jgi:hypothetical protein
MLCSTPGGGCDGHTFSGFVRSVDGVCRASCAGARTQAVALGIGRIGYRAARHSSALSGCGSFRFEQKDSCPEVLKAKSARTGRIETEIPPNAILARHASAATRNRLSIRAVCGSPVCSEIRRSRLRRTRHAETSGIEAEAEAGKSASRSQSNSPLGRALKRFTDDATMQYCN